MHLSDRFCIFSMASRKALGNVHYRDNLLPQFTTTHGRYWMQNAPLP